MSDRIKAAVPVRQFLLRYLELSPAGMGLCPFHDDHNPSLSVNDKSNFWYCFACESGGSIIDFWLRWRELTSPPPWPNWPRCSFKCRQPAAIAA